MVMADGVLMSIRPQFAEAILDGRKTVELRRRRPSFAEGTTVLIYSSAPDRHVLGSFVAGAILAAAPSELWGRVNERTGISRDVFDEYFAGCDYAYAIEILNPKRINATRLRIRPPQSYLFLRRGDRRHRTLLQLATASAT